MLEEVSHCHMPKWSFRNQRSECGGVLVAAALLRAVARLWEGDWDPVGCTRNGVVWKTPDYPAAAETGTIPVHRLKEPCSVFPHALCLA